VILRVGDPAGRVVQSHGGVFWQTFICSGQLEGKASRHVLAAMRFAANAFQSCGANSPAKPRNLSCVHSGRSNESLATGAFHRCAQENLADVGGRLQRLSVIFVADVFDCVRHAEDVLPHGHLSAGMAGSNSSATITSKGRLRSKLCRIQSR